MYDQNIGCMENYFLQWCRHQFLDVEIEANLMEENEEEEPIYNFQDSELWHYRRPMNPLHEAVWEVSGPSPLAPTIEDSSC